MTADTIFALSSGRPPAAVAVIRVSGVRAHEAGRILAGSLPEPRTAAVRQLRNPASGERLDDAVVLRFDSPASATGEDVVEFQCHGGRAVVEAVLAELGTIAGLRPAEPGEFTRRAFENGRIDLTEAEGLADLLEAETQSQRKAALALAEGGLRALIADWQEQLLMLSALAERAIDYDEDDGPADPELGKQSAELAAVLRAWLDRPRVEPLKDGVRVVVAGPPNAGKSSLINAISGQERAIVTAIPGTTRDHIEVPLSIGGLPIVLTDTAGLRATDDKVEAIGVKRTGQLVQTADVLIWMGSPQSAPSHSRMVQVQPKCDLNPGPWAGAIPVSAVSGQGLDVVLGKIAEHVRALLPAEGALALNQRQAACIEDAAVALADGAEARELVFIAEHLRLARSAFDRLTGRAGVEEVLDALFQRFCLGK